MGDDTAGNLKKRASVVVALLVLAVASGGILLSRGIPQRFESIDRARLFESVVRRIERDFMDSSQTGDLYLSALDGMLRRLGDPHASYIPQDRLVAMRETSAENNIGPGFELDEREGHLVVVSAYLGSSARAAGLRTGDRVIAVNGLSTARSSVDEVQLLLRGRPGSRVEVEVERMGYQRPISYSLARQDPSASTVSEAFLLPSGVGFVKMARVSGDSPDELRRALDGLREDGMRSLILDMRGNPGGGDSSLVSGGRLAELFVQRGVVVARLRGRGSSLRRELRTSAGGAWADIPLVILIDRGTASGAEILAGALQDLDRAVLVGSTSFGKGSEQEVLPLDAGGALKLTVARWETPLGRTIEPTAGRATAGAPGGADDNRPVVKTARGRTLFGGGGITPDVVVRRVEQIAADSLPDSFFSRGSASELAARDPFVRLGLSLLRDAARQEDVLAHLAAMGTDLPDGGPPE